jgi:hypothetical protein
MTESKIKRTPGGVPVHHSDHGLEESHYAFIDQILQEQNGLFAVCVSLPPECPDLLSALYGPTAGDLAICEEDVEYIVRNDRPGKSRMISLPLRPCRRLAVIGIAGDNAEIFSAYGTQACDPTPREWWDSSMKPHEAAAAAQFWCDHALSTGES